MAAGERKKHFHNRPWPAPFRQHTFTVPLSANCTARQAAAMDASTATRSNVGRSAWWRATDVSITTTRSTHAVWARPQGEEISPVPSTVVPSVDSMLCKQLCTVSESGRVHGQGTRVADRRVRKRKPPGSKQSVINVAFWR